MKTRDIRDETFPTIQPLLINLRGATGGDDDEREREGGNKKYSYHDEQQHQPSRVEDDGAAGRSSFVFDRRCCRDVGLGDGASLSSSRKQQQQQLSETHIENDDTERNID